MKLRSNLVIILAFLVIFTLPQYEVLSYSSASGYVDIEPDEWWYYPMVIESGDLLECSFQTDYGIVESFIVHEEYYVENTEISEQLLIYHSFSSLDDFEVTITLEGGWFWVFINNMSNTTRVHYYWEADSPSNVLAPFNLILATVLLTGILCLAGVLHLRKNRITLPVD
jgi:hypothetical protein